MVLWKFYHLKSSAKYLEKYLCYVPETWDSWLEYPINFWMNFMNFKWSYDLLEISAFLSQKSIGAREMQLAHLRGDDG